MTARLPRPIADAELEAYAASHSTPPSESLRAIAAATFAWSDYPAYMIDELESRLLTLLVAATGASRILEIGTFTGFSAVSMAEALPADGHVTTLEARPDHAAKAEEHVAAAGMRERITVIQGPAVASLTRLRGPFDFAFIDADKPAYPAYYEAVVPLMRPGGLIVADNVLRTGMVLDRESTDPGVVAMREFNARAASDPRVETVLLTVRDGISLIRVRD